jgi:hypothetical protein
MIAPWAAGTNTVSPVPISAGKARCERLGSDNPRISRQVTALVPDKTYRIDTVHTMGTAGLTTYYRVSSTANLTANDYAETTTSASGNISMTFTAPSDGMVYIGGVLSSGNNGDFFQTSENFTLTRLD